MFCPPWTTTMKYSETRNNSGAIFGEENKEDRKIAEWATLLHNNAVIHTPPAEASLVIDHKLFEN